MKHTNRRNSVSHRMILGLAAACLMVMPTTALADHTRSCEATLTVAPQELDAAEISVAFNVQATVPTYVMVNQARRWAREFILVCVRDHWAAREADESPGTCRRTQAMHPDVPNFPDYPFTNLSQDLTRALCEANSDALLLTADITLQIRGDDGCVRGGGTREEHRIAEGTRFACAGRIGEGSGFESVEEEPRRHRAPAPPPPPSPSDPAPPPPPSPPSPPEPPTTAADFDVLPNFRLPGNDIGVVDVPDGDWQACQRICAVNDACRAWTYRNRYQGTESVCLLKDSVGLPVPDLCCRSGIRQ